MEVIRMREKEGDSFHLKDLMIREGKQIKERKEQKKGKYYHRFVLEVGLF